MKNLTSLQMDKLSRHIEAFRLTAMLVDRQVDLSGLRPVLETTEKGTPKAPKLPKGDSLLGFAMMAASHFNLGIALELGLKCLTSLEGNSFKARHELTPLFIGLSAQSQSYIEILIREKHRPTWHYVVGFGFCRDSRKSRSYRHAVQEARFCKL